MKRLLLAPVVLLVAACSPGGPTPPPAAVPTVAPVESRVAPVSADAQRTDKARGNVDVLYCGGDPKRDWCKILRRVNGVPDLIVESSSLFVATTAEDTTAGRQLGDSMCTDIAIVPYDENGDLIGFRHVYVQSNNPEVFIGDCDVPDHLLHP